MSRKKIDGLENLKRQCKKLWKRRIILSEILLCSWKICSSVATSFISNQCSCSKLMTHKTNPISSKWFLHKCIKHWSHKSKSQSTLKPVTFHSICQISYFTWFSFSSSSHQEYSSHPKYYNVPEINCCLFGLSCFLRSFFMEFSTASEFH